MKAPRITPHVRRRLTGLALLGAVAALGVVLIPAGTAAPSTKPYTANICEASQLPSATNTYGEKPCPEPSTPPVLTGPVGGRLPEHSQQGEPAAHRLGKRRASDFDSEQRGTPVRHREPGGYPSPRWDRSRCHHGEPDHPSQPQPRPDRTLTVKITLKDVPVCVNGTYDWSAAGVIKVKQANDFSGAPGNDFVRAATGNSLTATLAGNCHLAIVPAISRPTP